MSWRAASLGPTIAGENAPTAIKIEHHKTSAVVWHPLGEDDRDTVSLRFYDDAEAVLARLPEARRAADPETHGATETPIRLGRTTWPNWSGSSRTSFGLPSTFTLDACRHGGMTELEEAELTTGQGRALSGHRTDRAYGGYAKRPWGGPLPRPASATLIGWRTIKEQVFRMTAQNAFRTTHTEDDEAIA